MRRFVVVAAVALAGCGGSGEGDGGCSVPIVWNGEARFGRDVADLRGRLPPVEGDDVTVRVPGCDDTGEDPPDHETTVRRLRGVPPEIALADAYLLEVYSLYLGEGFLVPSPAHPLHDAYYGSPDRPVERVDRRCARRRSDRGRVSGPVHGESGRFEVDGTEWQVDARTAIEAPEVAGAPRLRSGDEVTVTGRGCRGRRHVARELTVHR